VLRRVIFAIASPSFFPPQNWPGLRVADETVQSRPPIAAVPYAAETTRRNEPLCRFTFGRETSRQTVPHHNPASNQRQYLDRMNHRSQVHKPERGPQNNLLNYLQVRSICSTRTHPPYRVQIQRRASHRHRQKTSRRHRPTPASRLHRQSRQHHNHHRPTPSPRPNDPGRHLRLHPRPRHTRQPTRCSRRPAVPNRSRP
jgi:hypothetical protein